MRGAQRLLAIVDVLSVDSMTLTEIANAVELPKSTALRFLRALEESGWVLRNRDGVYSHGPTLIGLAARYLAGDPLVAAASEPMRELRDDLDETVSLSRRVGLGRVCVQEFPSSQNLRLVLGVGEPGPLHAGASGILLYAYLPDDDRERLVRGGLTRYTDRTLTDVDELEAEAAIVRQRGWSISRGTKTEGGLAMAVPILDPAGGGEVVALGVFGPELRASTEAHHARWLEGLRRCAEKIQAALAGSSPTTR